MKSEMTIEERLKASLICTAVGDALGAGVENWKLNEILAKFPEGVTEYTRTPRPNKPSTNGNPGDVTDDTAMTACILSGINKTLAQINDIHNTPYLLKTHAANFSFRGGEEELNKNPRQVHIDALLRNMFNAFLYWGKSQTTYSKVSGKDIATPDTNWDKLPAFNDTFGAGDGTIKILKQNKMGTLEHLTEKAPEDIEPGKSKYPEGCGALMRVGPVGIFCAYFPEFDAFNLGARSGAITHGDATSYIAAGIWAELIASVIKENISIEEAVTSSIDLTKLRCKVEANAEKRAGYDNCLKAIDIAVKYANNASLLSNHETVNALGKECGARSLFASAPVLAQALYAALVHEKYGISTDKALSIAVTQDGDSDSVAAVAGSLIGASKGYSALPSEKLINGLNSNHRAALKAMSEEFVKSAEITKAKGALNLQTPEMAKF